MLCQMFFIKIKDTDLHIISIIFEMKRIFYEEHFSKNIYVIYCYN